MNPSVSLLKNLENKLKQANIRSPYLTAYIGRSRNRIDLKDLDVVAPKGHSISQQLIDALCNTEKHGIFELDLSTASLQLSNTTAEERFQIDVLFKRLQSCYFDSIEDLAEHGTRSFGIGYPLLALKSKQDKTRTILAPLLIWQLEIKPNPSNHSIFTLSRKADAPIVFNPQLINFLNIDRGVVVPSIEEEFMEDDVISLEELNTIISQMHTIMPIEKINFSEGICKIEDKSYYERFVSSDNGLLFNAGILSLFKSNKESIVKDYQQLIAGYNDMLFDDSKLYQAYQSDHFAAVPLDPSQESILRNISHHKKVIIQGPPGTGKSNSLTGIILNALENNATVLVVCEKKTALEVIYENLKEKGLEMYCAVIDNIHADRQKIVKNIRDKIENKVHERPPLTGQNAYTNDKQQFTTYHEKLLVKYDNLLRPILGDMHWKDIIGKYLESKRKADDNGFLTTANTGLALNQETYFLLQETIKSAALIRTESDSLYSIFKPLQDKIFEEPLSAASLSSLKTALQSFIIKNEELLSNWEKLLNSYPSLEAAIKPGIAKKIIALFHSGLRKELSYNKALLQQSKELFAAMRPLLKIEDNISDNYANLPLINKKLRKQLEEIAAHLDSFRPYYNWRKFYLTTNDPALQKLIDALEGVPVNKWEDISRMWFLNLVLMEYEISLGDFPTDTIELQQLQDLGKEISSFQPSAIHSVLTNRLKKELHNRTLQSLRVLFNLRGNKTFTRRNSLRTLYHDEFALMNAFYPVLLINPAVCSSMLPLHAGIFDVVIFDEASQLKLEDTFPALIRGRFKVVSGDIHQMPPATHFSGNAQQINTTADVEEDLVYAEEESLLTFAQNADFEFNYLDFHYRSQHPQLISFSNAAFYGNRLIAMPISSFEKPIHFRQVMGTYDDNFNPKEAESIIAILADEITFDAEGKLPSVGIATFNMTQQRLIQEKIWEKADQDAAFRTKLSLLESAGLFVKNLENIQGDERDIILISTTFGRKADNSFIQNFGPINRDGGYKMLNVIVTRAKKQIYVVTSIPKEFYSNYKDEIITKGNTGKGIFYAYLNFAEMSDANNTVAMDELLAFLVENSTDKGTSTNKVSAANFLTESVFEEEVVTALLEHIPAHRIKTQFKVGGFRLDIVILNTEGEPVVVIECDGKTYHKSAVAHRYDIHRQQILERFGLHVYRIWSTNWWRNPTQEINATLAFINQHIAIAQPS